MSKIVFKKPKPDLLTVPEVMAELRLSRSSVYMLINTGTLKSLRIGSNRRIRRQDLAAYLEAQLTPDAHRD